MNPDFLYDPDNWECTYDWSDRFEATESAEIGIGEFKQFSTLLKGPPKFAAHVVLSRDDAGDPDETEIQWFDSEEAAKAAVAHTSHQREQK